jgi:hypothetical protein
VSVHVLFRIVLNSKSNTKILTIRKEEVKIPLTRYVPVTSRGLFSGCYDLFTGLVSEGTLLILWYCPAGPYYGSCALYSLNIFIMSRFLKRTLLILLIIPVSLMLLILVAGLVSGRAYEGSRAAVVNAPPDSVWQFVNDTRRYCSFRHEVSAVELDTTAPKDMPRWTENTGLAGTISMAVIRRVAPSYLEVEMTRSSFGLSGFWQFCFAPVPEGTYVLITERSSADGIVMRGILSLLGRHSNMDLQLNVIKKGLAHAH